ISPFLSFSLSLSLPSSSFSSKKKIVSFVLCSLSLSLSLFFPEDSKTKSIEEALQKIDENMKALAPPFANISFASSPSPPSSPPPSPSPFPSLSPLPSSSPASCEQLSEDGSEVLGGTLASLVERLTHESWVLFSLHLHTTTLFVHRFARARSLPLPPNVQNK